MFTASLRRSGGSLIMTIPQAWAEQNRLAAGSKLQLEIAGTELRLSPARPRKNLEALLASTPEGLQRVEGWDELADAGHEQ